MRLQINIAKTNVMIVDNTQINVHNLLVEMLKGTYTVKLGQ